MSEEVTDIEFTKRLAFLYASGAWPVLKAGLEAQIKHNFDETFKVLDERAVNRIVGGCQALTKFIEQVDSATGNLVAQANGDQSAGIQLNVL